MSDPVLSIVIVNWNVRELLAACLESLRSRRSFEVIVVDNASADESAAMVSDRFPHVRLIANDANLGFPRACNQGLAEARGSYVLFLNPDCVVAPDTIDYCLDHLETNPRTGAVGCRLTDEEGRPHLSAARRTHRPLDLAWEYFLLRRLFPKSRVFGRLLMGDFDHLDDREVECISGAFLLAPERLLRALGGMDESIFMYFEDMDLCLRIRRAGYRIFYLGRVSALHHVGSSSKQVRRESSLWLHDAYEEFFRRHFGRWDAMLFRFIVFTGSIFRISIICAASVLLAASGRRRAGFDLTTLGKYWTLLRWSLNLAPRVRQPVIRGGKVVRSSIH